MAGVRMRVSCWMGQLEQVDANVVAAAAVYTAWERVWQRWVAAAGAEPTRRERRAALREERDWLISHGMLARSRAEVLRYAVEVLVQREGWRSRRWRPVPSSAYQGPGRWWGSRSVTYNASVTIDLPDRTADLLRRVAYWSSLPAMRRLRHAAESDEWRSGSAWPRSSASMAQYADLSADIRTPGDLLRDALDVAAEYRYPDDIPSTPIQPQRR